jgi:surface protein
MFCGACAFNQPIGNWDTGAVTDIAYMFGSAYAFNQPIGSWNTSAVTNMAYMFSGARAFNQPIGNWNTSAVTNMAYMFRDARAFNQPIGHWDIILHNNRLNALSNMFIGAMSFQEHNKTARYDLPQLAARLRVSGIKAELMQVMGRPDRQCFA